MEEVWPDSIPLSGRRLARSAALTVLITGTHSTGKTTLIRDVVARMQSPSVAVIGESARHCPFLLNNDQNILSSTWLVAAQLMAEVEARTRHGIRLVVCDRGLPDILAYHELATGTVEPWLVALAEEWLCGYDRVFVAQPDPARPMSADELRVTDVVFRANVQRIIERHVVKAGVSFEFLPHGGQERRRLVGSWLSEQRGLP